MAAAAAAEVAVASVPVGTVEMSRSPNRSPGGCGATLTASTPPLLTVAALGIAWLGPGALLSAAQAACGSLADRLRSRRWRAAQHALAAIAARIGH